MVAVLAVQLVGTFVLVRGILVNSLAVMAAGVLVLWASVGIWVVSQ